ncbi:MAG: hypothetical protein ACIARQ_15320 [Phycisphaerales bacterium JB061]
MTLASTFKPMSGVRISIAPHEPIHDSTEIDACWDRMRAQSPRLFDGGILSFLGEEGGTIRAARETYKHLAVQVEDRSLLERPVMQLSVTGVLVAKDKQGTPHVLMGRRSEDTRIYGSLWELGPSGGIDPPAHHISSLDQFAVIRQLQLECQDELGIAGVFTSHAVLGLIDDHLAMSTDIVVRLDLQRNVDELVQSTSNWEYTETRWVPASELVAFGEQEQTIPPTAALIPIVANMLTD